MRKILCISFLFLLPFYKLVAGQGPLDSLKNVLKQFVPASNTASDTALANILSALVDEAPDEEWPQYNEQLFRHLESALKRGTIDRNYYDKSMSSVISNRGFYAQQHGNLKLALNCYHQALRLSEKTKDEYGVATALNNIGVIFLDEGELNKALKYYARSYTMHQKFADKSGLARVANNLAGIYDKKREYKKAYEYYFEALKIQETNNVDLEDRATTLNNVGYLFERIGDPDCTDGKESCIEKGKKKAEEYYKRSLAMHQQQNNKEGVSFSYLSMARLYLLQGKNAEAEKLAEHSMKISSETGFAENIRNAASLLYVIYKKKSQYKKSMEMYSLFIQMRDSLNNSETKREAVKTELQYEYETQAIKDSIKAAEERKLVQVQIEKEENNRYLLLGGFSLVSVFALFMVNRFRVARKQKRLIEGQKQITEHQKKIVEMKQSEILDSIRYAKRIQTALMAPEFYIRKELERLNRNSQN